MPVALIERPANLRNLGSLRPQPSSFDNQLRRLVQRSFGLVSRETVFPETWVGINTRRRFANNFYRPQAPPRGESPHYSTFRKNRAGLPA